MSKETCCKKTSIGGQAVIEGIMMRGPKKTTLAVRTPDGSITKEEVNFPNPAKKCKICKVPIIRGIISFAITLFVGYKTLMRSADLSGMTELEEEEEEKKKTDKIRKKAEKKGISVEEMTEIYEKKHSENNDKLMNVVMILSSVLGVALAVFLFMWVPAKLFNLINTFATSGVNVSFNPIENGLLNNWRAFFEGLVKIAIFIAYIAAVSQTPDIKKVFQYHGAEHKTIFCYEKGLELNVENIKKQTRFHPRCGTSFMFLMIAVGIIFSTIVIIFAPGVTKITALWVTVKILLVPLFCGFGFEILKWCGRHDNLFTKIVSAPGLWVQRLTTKEPTDEIIEVAIVAMEDVIPENGEDLL